MARIFLDEMGGVNQGGILASYGLPMSPFNTEEYVAPTQEVREQPIRATKKKSNKRKTNKKSNNDGIIRNHDSVWDYKIQNGKLLTRRKTSNGNWIDITSNEEARQRIEQFTGRSIGNKQNVSSNSSQTSKPASTTKPSNNSQSQPNKPTSTGQTQQTTRPATTQPIRQQVVRQDSTRQQTTQPRNLATTRGSNTEPDWQNMTDAEVQAYFANSPLGGVTRVVKGNPNKKKELLSAEDLAANGWHWSNGQASFGDKDTDNFNLLNSARDKVEAGDNILLDANGAVVPTSEVRRYINRGRIPLYISDYDAQFYQPQAYSKPHEVRMAELKRWENNYNKQQNAALATMFSLPALGISAATAPVTTALAVGGSELVGAGFEGAWKHATGKSWAESLGATDANSGFYADMIQPGRAIGGLLGGGVAYATAPERQAISRAISNGVNNIVGNGEMPSFLGLLQRQAYANRSTGFRLPSIQQQTSSMKSAMPKVSRKLSGNVSKTRSLADAKAATKEYWESRQPYQVKVKKDATGRLYPTFNTKKVNGKFKGYPSYDDANRLTINSNTLERILSNYADLSKFGRNGETRYLIESLKGDINQLYGLPSGYWQSVRPAPGYLEGPRYGGGIIIRQ